MSQLLRPFDSSAFAENAEGTQAVLAIWTEGSAQAKTWVGETTTADDATRANGRPLFMEVL